MPRRTRIGPFPATRLTQPDGSEVVVRTDRVDAVREAKAGKVPTAEVLLAGGAAVAVRGTVEEVLTLLRGASVMDPDSSIAALRLTQRARLALDSIGVRTVHDLISKSAADVNRGHLCGPRTLNEIQEALAAHGLTLSE